MHGHWIQTYSQRTYRLDRPDPRDVCIADIAHALAAQCRFNGHTEWGGGDGQPAHPYSVAQHSVIVSRIVGEICGRYAESLDPRINLPLMGLLHDSHEAFVGDVVSPLKALLGEPWQRIEFLAECAVQDAFALPCRPGELEVVKTADRIALAMEARDLLPGGPIGWTLDLPEPLDWKIEPVSPVAAREAFTMEFWRLTRGGEQ